jgi:signal transduction histidine kinase
VKKLIALVAAWTAVALFVAITNSITYMSFGQPPRWWLSIRLQLVEWGVWAALTPAVLWYARRVPFGRRTWLAGLVSHAAGGLVASLAQMTAARLLREWLLGVRSYLVISNIAPDLLVYAMLVGIVRGTGYYRAARARELRASQIEARLAEARLATLRTQLQPHFLFNTLNAIAELVHEAPDAADRMIAGLSDLLRETLDTGGAEEVPLAREIDLLRRYVDIQRVRFGERLRVSIDVAGDAPGARVPALLLQPIVENAIRHGIGPRAAGGRIDVVARREGEWLRIEVADDGVGLPAHVVEGVGLGGTRARLETLYGRRQRLEVRPRPGGGTVVVIDVPWSRGSDDEPGRV